MINKLPEIQIHSCAKINEKLNEVIDWVNDVSALRVTDLPNIDAGELAFLSKENSALKDELERTRKALDVAVDKLNGIKAFYDDSYADPRTFVNWHIVAQRLANDADDAVKDITTLEQKDK